MADYIDREELIVKFQQLADIEWNKETGTSWANAFFEAVDIIDDMPSADVRENVHGEWVKAPAEDWCTFDTCKCSECGVVEYFNKGWKWFNFCPNCGARMVNDG